MKDNKLKATLVLEIMTKGRSFIKKGWCQGAMARSRYKNQAVDFDHPNANSWCATGAVEAATECYKFYMYYNDVVACSHVSIGILENILGGENIVCWNDNKERTQQEVLDLFDRGIVAAEDIRERVFDNEYK